MKILIIVLISLAAVLAILFALAFVCDRVAFGKRYDKNPLLKYFTADQFGLSTEQAEIPRGKKFLRGYIYNPQTQSNGKLIIFCHGTGPGHIAYTTEIAYFCKLGFKVLAIDSSGCNFSDGKRIKGMYEGVKTAVAAIDFARANLKESEIYLVGHSWGAYSVLCASAHRKVKGVVSFSAPNTPVSTVANAAANIISKPLALILSPFWYIINLFKFGINGNANAAKCVQKSGVPTLLIHGDKDNIVNIKRSAYYKANGVNITKYLAKGKAHNPYNTAAAEEQLSKLLAKLMQIKKLTEEDKKFFEEFDFSVATEEDEKVMQTVSEFLRNRT